MPTDARAMGIEGGRGGGVGGREATHTPSLPAAFKAHEMPQSSREGGLGDGSPHSVSQTGLVSMRRETTHKEGGGRRENTANAP